MESFVDWFTRPDSKQSKRTQTKGRPIATVMWHYRQTCKKHERWIQSDDQHPIPFMRRLVLSFYFQALANMVVFTNCIWIGWQADILSPTDSEKMLVNIFEQSYTVVFFLELVCRLLCYGWTHITIGENRLDAMLVMLSVTELWILGSLGIQVQFLTKLGVLRTLRMMRLGKALRTRPEFKEMWALLKGLSNCAETLFWTYIMILGFVYFFAVTGTALIGKQAALQDDEIAQVYFGDVLRSMLTFWQLMTIDAWPDIVRPLIAQQIWIGFFLMFYMSIGMFVLLNLITAVIIDEALVNAKEDEKDVALEAERKKEEELEDLGRFFMDLDKDGSGSLTRSELFEAIANDKVRAKLRALEIMPQDIDELWDILDDDNGDGELSIEEFVEGIRKLQGEARAKDVLKLYYDLRLLEGASKQVDRSLKASTSRMQRCEVQLERCQLDLSAFHRTLARTKEAVKLAGGTQGLH